MERLKAVALTRHEVWEAVRTGEIGRRAPTSRSLAQVEEFQASPRAIEQKQSSVFARGRGEKRTAKLWHQEHSSRSKIPIHLVHLKGVGRKVAKLATVPAAVPEHWVLLGSEVVLIPVQVEVVAERSEFPVEKIRFPDSSLAGPAPDIQIVSKKKLVAELDCLSSSWFAGSAARVVPFQLHPKSQPRG